MRASILSLACGGGGSDIEPLFGTWDSDTAMSGRQPCGWAQNFTASAP